MNFSSIKQQYQKNNKLVVKTRIRRRRAWDLIPDRSEGVGLRRLGDVIGRELSRNREGRSVLPRVPHPVGVRRLLLLDQIAALHADITEAGAEDNRRSAPRRTKIDRNGKSRGGRRKTQKTWREDIGEDWSFLAAINGNGGEMVSNGTDREPCLLPRRAQRSLEEAAVVLGAAAPGSTAPLCPAPFRSTSKLLTGPLQRGGEREGEMWDLDAGIPPAIASTAQRKTPSIGCKDFLDGLGSKTPFQWDWGSPVAFTGREIDIPKDAQEIDLRIEDLCSSGCGASSVLELSNWSDKSSLYASIGSLSDTERRKPELNIQPTERTLQFSDKIIYPWVVDSQTSPIAVETGHPKEPLTGLKLGRNFEDVDAENNIKNFPSASLASSSATIKKSRLSQQNVLSPYCLVDGCNIDLTTAKEYHRKHKICESHSKSPKVIIAGQARRFCQQCSRLALSSLEDIPLFLCIRAKDLSLWKFVVSCFCVPCFADPDTVRSRGKIVSCDLMLAADRFLNCYLLCSVLFVDHRLFLSDDERKMNLVFGQAPMGSSSWDGLTSFHLRQSEESRIKSNKARCTDRQLQFSATQTHIGSTGCDELNKLLPSKGTTAEVLNQDMGAFVFYPNSERALDLRHALSLLSNDSCGPAERLKISGIKFIDANHTSIADPTTAITNSICCKHHMEALFQIPKNSICLTIALILILRFRFNVRSLVIPFTDATFGLIESSYLQLMNGPKCGKLIPSPRFVE
ncbi:hypothetical protein ZIOFF_044981 [Zingiber officinale]|uniref:SBP-type domain-containing protein n=1 Tax=Zingiber officinale TaxID=94328 RepID=A0A8J5KUW2_ZINOF|nr:hypothetical protein ZIOFF_044981 [Zingiber officinale]